MVNMKAVTLRIPEPVHRKLRMLAASKGVTMTDMLIALIEDAKLDTPEEVATVKSLLQGAASTPRDESTKAKPKAKPTAKESKAKLKKTLKQRKDNAEFPLD